MAQNDVQLNLKISAWGELMKRISNDSTW